MMAKSILYFSVCSTLLNIPQIHDILIPFVTCKFAEVNNIIIGLSMLPLDPKEGQAQLGQWFYVELVVTNSSGLTYGVASVLGQVGESTSIM